MPDIDLAGNVLYVKSIKSGYNNPGSLGTPGSNNVAAGSTLTLTSTTHAGRVILLDTVTGSVATLPASTGSGDSYRFYVTLAPTSNAHKIQVANGTDIMTGLILNTTTAGDSDANTFPDATTTTDDTISMNGTTSGGIIGSYVTCMDIATNKWLINGLLIGSGTLITSLSAAVS